MYSVRSFIPMKSLRYEKTIRSGAGAMNPAAQGSSSPSGNTFLTSENNSREASADRERTKRKKRIESRKSA